MVAIVAVMAVMTIVGLQDVLPIVGIVVVVIILPGTLLMVEDQEGTGLDHPILLLIVARGEAVQPLHGQIMVCNGV